MKILVTGAAGFIGSALVSHLHCASGHCVIAASRREMRAAGERVVSLRMRDAGPGADWSAALADTDAVIHLAACVHEADVDAGDLLAEHRRVNAAGTLNLAHQAAEAGVRRFVFISTVKVNGESTKPGQPYRSEDPPAPADPYAISKREAEDGLRALAAESGMELVIVRPPLVYGPGVKANFLRLMEWIERGVPLPFGNADNRRSLIYLDNLVDFLVLCVEHPRAAGETFLVSDGEDLSVADLVRRLARAMGREPRLFPAPRAALANLLPLLGGEGLRRRLFGSLQVDATKALTRLDWNPPCTVEEGLAETARWFRGRPSPE